MFAIPLRQIVCLRDVDAVNLHPHSFARYPVNAGCSHLVIPEGRASLLNGGICRVDLGYQRLDPQGTEFQQAAWMALRSIAFAESVSYGEQARRMGDGRKARAVGAANGRNPLSIVVPCHRVVGADGSLTGFAAGIDAKKWLLSHERLVADAQGSAAHSN